MTVTKRKPRPITAHPMFPHVTGLWFAAFLGLGSFAIAPGLLEGPVVALGIPDIIPAAQPPLGFTVRALLALVMLGVGGAMGFLIGKYLGRGAADAPVRARSFARTAKEEPVAAVSPRHRRPLNPAEDLGDPSLRATYAPVDATAFVAADDAPFAAPAMARLPWEQDDDAPLTPTAPNARSDDDSPALDLLFEDAEVLHDEAIVDRQVFMTTDDARFVHADDADAFAGTMDADWSPTVADTPEPEAPEPEAPEPEALVSAPLAAEPARGVPAKTPLLQAPAVAPAPLARTPLHELGLVQLTERLALAIGRRTSGETVRDVQPEPAEPQAEAFQSGGFSVVPPPPASAIARFHAAAPAITESACTDTVEAAPDTKRVVQLRPAALQPVLPETDSFDEDEVPGLDRFLRVREPRPAQLAPAFDETAGEDEIGALAGDETSAWHQPDHDEVDAFDAPWDGPQPDDETGGDPYPSLLDMGPARRRHQDLQIAAGTHGDGDDAADGEEEPVVVFPGQSAPFEPAARLFERPAGAVPTPTAILPVPGSPLAAPGRAAPSSPIDALEQPDMAQLDTASVGAEEADRALRAALATLQRMTAQG